MDKIQEYVEAMFSGLPKTKRAVEMKLGILESMEEHYNRLLEEGKSPEEALGTVISRFGSMEEIRKELGEDGAFQEHTMPVLSPEQVKLKQEYNVFNRLYPVLVSLSIVLYIIGMAVQVSLDAKAETLGNILFLLIVAIATGLLVFTGMRRRWFKQELKGKLEPDSEEDEEENEDEKHVPSAAIYMGATVIFLLIGFFYNAWHPGWVVYVAATFIVEVLKWIEKSKRMSE